MSDRFSRKRSLFENHADLAFPKAEHSPGNLVWEEVYKLLYGLCSRRRREILSDLFSQDQRLALECWSSSDEGKTFLSQRDTKLRSVQVKHALDAWTCADGKLVVSQRRPGETHENKAEKRISCLLQQWQRDEAFRASVEQKRKARCVLAQSRKERQAEQATARLQAAEKDARWKWMRSRDRTMQDILDGRAEINASHAVS
eukprot:TRINITY_DN45674_c0_g1_i1.p1 TRINITY_DN45674_c0_g1~~TRINITY_DN45674_c0_g1_i1.p1  ORF type:complete len:201 (-),score=15.99 TRINITY_DN45674_c0_g1_i1:361-963(-)